MQKSAQNKNETSSMEEFKIPYDRQFIREEMDKWEKFHLLTSIGVVIEVLCIVGVPLFVLWAEKIKTDLIQRACMDAWPLSVAYVAMWVLLLLTIALNRRSRKNHEDYARLCVAYEYRVFILQIFKSHLITFFKQDDKGGDDDRKNTRIGIQEKLMDMMIEILSLDPTRRLCE